MEILLYIWLVNIFISFVSSLFLFENAQAAEQGHQRVCAILIEKDSSLLNISNKQRLTPAHLAEQSGFPSLANELRLRANSLIQFSKASIVRLVIKKRNVPRSDASSQVNEIDFNQHLQ